MSFEDTEEALRRLQTADDVRQLAGRLTRLLDEVLKASDAVAPELGLYVAKTLTFNSAVKTHEKAGEALHRLYLHTTDALVWSEKLQRLLEGF